MNLEIRMQQEREKILRRLVSTQNDDGSDDDDGNDEDDDKKWIEIIAYSSGPVLGTSDQVFAPLWSPPSQNRPG